MTKSTVVLLLIIAALIALIVLGRACSSTPIVPVVKHDTVYVTIRDTFLLDRPIPSEEIENGKQVPLVMVKHDTTFYVTKENVDTATILNDYFAEKIYRDTAKSKFGEIRITDTVTQNKIKGRSVYADWKIPVVTNSTVVPPKLKLFGGFDIGSNGTTTVGFGPIIQIQTKNDNLYHLGADFLPGIGGTYFHAGISWKIHF